MLIEYDVLNNMADDNTKTCFIIMPISDMDGYEKGHFDRVYKHLIIPACVKAGYKAVRADDVDKSNYIVVDIMTKVANADMAICDLSGKNPNVMFELGFRQAFNLPTVLLKDKKTSSIFDIQGLRYTTYDESLRIDQVEMHINLLASAIQSTSEPTTHDILSLVQLISIKPANLPSEVNLSNDTSILLNAITDISNRLAKVEIPSPIGRVTNNNQNKKTDKNQYNINDFTVDIGDELYVLVNDSYKSIGILTNVKPSYIITKKDGKLNSYSVNDSNYSNISNIPF
ncbi:hypothetical protein C0Z01_15150 [Photobacterium kishitanii]|nr:hypothetical protein AYY22_02375 [Photobacterium kishitanii]PSW68451.1 hypothetical protein C0Z01_15150 [Photobacterium kishitanii]